VSFKKPSKFQKHKLIFLESNNKHNNQHNQNKNVNTTRTSLHALLLLSDSALPLGSFAYSSGLESYLAHNKPSRTSPANSFHRFLKLSIASIASTSLPYVLAGYREPETLETLDNDLDASTPCIVAQRASIAQGRALIGVWERAFRSSFAGPETATPADPAAVAAIDDLSDALKACVDDDDLGPKGHFAPLWGTVCRAMGLDLQQTAYVFVVNHAKAVLSAAVRASVMGPYQAQNVLASQSLQDTIMKRIGREWNTPVEQAGQVVPALDLWVGRHELLYSRIFNS
jgi:urease accessory protein